MKLEGIRVLDLSLFLPGPLLTQMMADHGADVIKLEPLGGDISRPIGRTYFYNLNCNKRSVSANTGSPARRSGC